MSEALSISALNPRILNQERNSASQSISSFSETLFISGKPSIFHQVLQASICQEWFSLTERHTEEGVSDCNYWHTRMCQNMKLYSWCWFNVLSAVLTRKRKEVPGSLLSRAQNWQPGKAVQLLFGMAIPKGVGRQAGQVYGKVSLAIAAHLVSAPWGRSVPGGATPVNFFMVHWLRTQEKSMVPYLSLLIWIKLNLVVPQVTGFSSIKQK